MRRPLGDGGMSAKRERRKRRCAAESARKRSPLKRPDGWPDGWPHERLGRRRAGRRECSSLSAPVRAQTRRSPPGLSVGRIASVRTRAATARRDRVADLSEALRARALPRVVVAEALQDPGLLDADPDRPAADDLRPPPAARPAPRRRDSRVAEQGRRGPPAGPLRQGLDAPVERAGDHRVGGGVERASRPHAVAPESRRLVPPTERLGHAPPAREVQLVLAGRMAARVEGAMSRRRQLDGAVEGGDQEGALADLRHAVALGREQADRAVVAVRAEQLGEGRPQSRRRRAPAPAPPIAGAAPSPSAAARR